MVESSTGSGVQSFDGEGQQPHNPVLGRPSVIHNYFLDHIDNSDGNHHHHGPRINDILVHKHDGTADHHHYLRAYDNDGGSNDHYGSAIHNHAATNDDLDSAPHYVIDFVTTNNNDDNSWANDIDNITAGNPYDHTPN